MFVTVHEDALMVERGMSVGALGYVLKETAGRELVPAVRAALAGERYVSRALSEWREDGATQADCEGSLAGAQLNVQHIKGPTGLKAGSQPAPHVYVIAPLVWVTKPTR